MVTRPNEIAPFQMLRIDRSCAAMPGSVYREAPPSTWVSVSWGLAGACAAALAYGVATVLQAIGARQADRASGPDARLALRLMRSAPYVGGLLLDGIGFALSLAALRSQPLFTVQAIVSSSLAVTALLAVVVLQARL